MAYTYTVTVYTGNVKDAGTDAKVWISLYGPAVKPLKENFRLNSNAKNLFERGAVNSFTFTDSQKYDAVNYCQVWHDNSGKAPGWYLDKIVITCKETGKQWVFIAHRWLSKTDGDKKINVFLYIWDHYYNVTIRTGNHKYGGTDAKVYVTLYGSSHNSSERKLPASRGAFEVNDEDSFELKTTQDLGWIKSMRIRHDNSGKDPGWYVESVKITCLNDGVISYIPVHRWFSKEDDDGKISRIVYVASNSLGQRYRYTDKRAFLVTYDIKSKNQKSVISNANYMADMFRKKKVPCLAYNSVTEAYLRKEIKDWYINTTKDSQSFIFAHCHAGSDGTLGLVTDRPNGLPLREFKNMLDQIQGVKVLFLYTCHSGRAISTRSLTPNEPSEEEAILQEVENVFFPKKDSRLRSGEFRANDYHVFCSCTETANTDDAYKISKIWAAGCNSLKPATVQKLQNYTISRVNSYYNSHKWKAHLRPQLWSPNPDMILFD